MSKTYTGATLCCGKVPSFGKHNYNEYPKGVFGPGNGYHCETCKRSASYWTADKDDRPFAAECWNKKFQVETPDRKYDSLFQLPLDAPKGYGWCVYSARAVLLGRTENFRGSFMLFSEGTRSMPSPSESGSWRYLDKLRLLRVMTGKSFEVPLGKRITASLTAGYVTDGTRFLNLSIQAMGPMAYKALQELKLMPTEDARYRYRCVQ